MNFPPRCEDPELSLGQRIHDGSQALLAAFVQLVIVVALIPLWILLGAVMLAALFFTGTKVGKAILVAVDPWFKAAPRIFALPSDSLVLSWAERALSVRDGKELGEALGTRGFMGLRAVRPRDKAKLLARALNDRELCMADVIVAAGCRVDGLFPDFDALEWGARQGDLELEAVRWAIALGASPRANLTQLGTSQVTEAVKKDAVGLLEILVEAESLSDWAKGEALRDACEHGKPKVLSWMLARADWSGEVKKALGCRRSPTLLMRGAWSRECAKILLPVSRASQASYPATPELMRLLQGSMFRRIGPAPCSVAKVGGDGLLDVLAMLEAAGADMRAVERKGETLLHRAAAWRDAAIVSWALKRGIDPGSRDEAGQTPLMWAAKEGNLEAIEELAAVSSVEAVDGKGRAALMLLAASSPPGQREDRDKMAAACRALLRAGADPQTLDKKGLLAVDHAARSANGPIFELLSSKSAWSHDAVEKALSKRVAQRQSWPQDVASIGAAVARAREAAEIGAAAPEPAAPTISRRL